MKKRILIIFICALSSTGFYLYLSLRGQALLHGDIQSSSICHINDYLNCDTVLASNYTKFANIPISDWGMATAVMIATLAGSLLIGLVESSFVVWAALAFFVYLSAGAAFVMLSLSFFILKVFCPFCVVLYLLSFSMAGLFAFPSELKTRASISQVWHRSNRKFLLGFLVSWVGLALLSYIVSIQIKNTGSTQQKVESFFLDWKSAPVKTTSIQPLLEKGSETAKISITEFADFLCYHCHKSYYLLKALLASNPDIRIRFFSFPLDHCKNKKGISCFLAKAVQCAQDQNHGWRMHDTIFEHQKSLSQIRDLQKVKRLLKTLYLADGFYWETWEQCVQSKESLKLIQQQIQAGVDMKIAGTPAFFVNDKKMSGQYFIQILQKIRVHLSY